MKTRFIGVVAALGAIMLFFTVVVLTIAAVQDYQENRGRSFIERAGSIVRIGSLTEESDLDQVKIFTSDDDVGEPDGEFEGLSDAFRFFGRSEDNEGWLGELLDGEWVEEEESFWLEDRLERLPDRGRSEGFERWRFDDFEFEDPWGTDWVDELIERGWMTDEDVYEFESWLEDLPDHFEERFHDFADERDFEFDSDDGRFRFRWRWSGSEDDGFFEDFREFREDIENGV